MRSAKMMIPRVHPRATISSTRSCAIQACDPCRKRKAKCNGTKSCLSCGGLEIDCTYTELKHPRETVLLRSRVQRLERMIKLILSRTSPSSSAATVQECNLDILPLVIGTIRSSASVHDAATRLNKQLPLHRHQMTLEKVQLAWMTRLSGQADLIEQEAPYRVHTTKLWSSLAGDAAASHLFSLFFVWDNPTWRVLEPRLFLHSFTTGDTSFCSSLLVHTILFYACYFSYDMEKPWDRHEDRDTARQLFRVIEKLWDRDKARICVPTMQSSLILGVFFCGTGKDTLGLRYIQYGAMVALRLGLHTSSAEAFRGNLRAHKIIACAVYDMESLWVQMSERPSVWLGPPEVFMDEAEATAADLGEQWTPYPFTTPVYRPYTNTSTWARRYLLIIVNEVAQLSLNLGSLVDLSIWQRGAALYKRLDTFKRTLPSVLEVETNKSPHNLCLHLYYHMAAVNLCGLFISRQSISRKDTLAGLTNFDPHRVLGGAMDSMGALILLYRACHGWKSIPVVMTHYFLVVGIHAASHLEYPKWREILVASVAGLWHMSLTWRLARAFLRTIELVLNLNANTAYIPKEAQSILREHREKVWMRSEVEQLAANYVIHHYPNLNPEAAGSSHSGSGRFHGETLKRVIRAFDRLSTDGSEV
ncbi:hypothetical protein BO78DRAFT_440475 [Aspergillus sclerotiicarbonarius CBS 121057]|uniref:Zn(2)-C6 fungal-type domain-containing protein n=1 Tax=Aspergillus sclerotiicarbonarius (strain CBS 121057 / IBT 28362) TaxID=1448318 RepID=A0A319EEY8_ASPSB|nr:hypothetical protein BO78DRAFT_440475 [Aspergillus sclerotiicarbonarius CBS 121057]